MDEKHLEKLRAALDHVHQWPSIYMFKFILPTDEMKIESLKKIFGESVEIILKKSKNGKYTSLTIKEMMLNADSIFERYIAASKIEGIISL